MNGNWMGDICEGIGNNGSGFPLKANANIALSNKSIVYPICSHYSQDYIYCTGYSLIWCGNIVVVSGAPKAGDKILLSVLMSYYPESGQEAVIIWKDVPIFVQACP